MAWLFAAFTVVWVIFFSYLVNLHRKQRAISDEIAGLKSKMSRGDAE